MRPLLAAIAFPNFVKFQCRSKQSESKGNLKAVQGMLGHASIASSQRYAHVLIDDLRELVEDAPAAAKSPPGRVRARRS